MSTCEHGVPKDEACDICVKEILRHWVTLDELDDDRIHHVYPTFGREHVTDKRAECWCGPEVKLVEGGAIIVHTVEQ